MHLNFEQILWALVLAAHLVLLIVLLGRERVGRFPFFTAAIALSATRLIADHLLHGKLTTIAFYWQSYSLSLVGSILLLLVLAEAVRRVFRSGRAGRVVTANGLIGWGLIAFAIAGTGVWAWGPWPAWKTISSDSTQMPLLLTVLSALKGELLTAMLAVEVSLLLLIFARRFGFRWTSHARQIVLGLSTIALAQLTVQAITESIKRTVHLTSRDQYDHIVRLFTNLDNGRFAIWLIVLIWWIVWLWRSEPGTLAQEDPEAGLEPALVGPDSELPPTLEAELPEN